ncbi:TPA: LysR family transcriptional regulator, partial [Pseudomonas aeruginosa]|nr:LysR family transcriptional regulator [Pseudomonas aeruginosa]
PFHLELVFLAQRERDIALQWLVEQIRQVGAAGPD